MILGVIKLFERGRIDENILNDEKLNFGHRT